MFFTSLADAFQGHIKGLYNAESQLVRVLPVIARAASSPSLTSLLRDQLRDTRCHMQRLEQIAILLSTKPHGRACRAMAGLLEELKELLRESERGPIMDAMIIASAQRVGHYQIAAYGSARAIAEQLGNPRVAEILHQSLEDEGAADGRLSQVMESEVLLLALGCVAAHDGS